MSFGGGRTVYESSVNVPAAAMEGTLHKWTNYVNGWQPRWFVISGGVLSYYMSREEAHQGCRGSVSLKAAILSVNPTDNLRFTVEVPDDSSMYLKAQTTSQRQQWVIAIGATKLTSNNIENATFAAAAAATAASAAAAAAATDTGRGGVGGSGGGRHGTAAAAAAATGTLLRPHEEPLTPNSQSLGRVMRAIKQHRKHLVHQLTAVQARMETIADTDIEELTRDQAGKLRRDANRANTVCVELLRALRDLSKLSPAMSEVESDFELDNSFGGGSIPSTPQFDNSHNSSNTNRFYPTGIATLSGSTMTPSGGGIIPFVLDRPPLGHKSAAAAAYVPRSREDANAGINQSNGAGGAAGGDMPAWDRVSPGSVSSSSSKSRERAATEGKLRKTTTTTTTTTKASTTASTTPNANNVSGNDGGVLIEEMPTKAKKTRPRSPSEESFFSTQTHDFSSVFKISGGSGGSGSGGNNEISSNSATALSSIEVTAFLAACEVIVNFVTNLGSTAFAPVRSDMSGNMDKLRAKMLSAPVRFSTLQAIVTAEVEEGTTAASGSSTDALLWLRRGLVFVNALLTEIVTSDDELAVAATRAYGRSLRNYHGWVVRGAFSLAMKSVPYRRDFLASLGPAHSDTVLGDMATFNRSLTAVVDAIAGIFREHGLDLGE